MRWYDRDGTVVDGATLREARANHYYPSVTSILEVISKPGVEVWKRNIIIDEAMKMSPIFADHEMDEFKEAVRERAEAKFKEAAYLGTLFHEDIERYMIYGEKSELSNLPMDSAVAIKDKMKELEISVEIIEQKFVKTVGISYAGTIDIIGYRMAGDVKVPLVLDWKTQATNGGRPRYYDQWPMQLAAYANAIDIAFLPKFEIWNCVVSTTDPGSVWFKRWKNPLKWLAAFDAAHELWSMLNNYDPESGLKVLGDDE